MVVVLEAGGSDAVDPIPVPRPGRRCGGPRSTGRTRPPRSRAAPARSTSGRAGACSAARAASTAWSTSARTRRTGTLLGVRRLHGWDHESLLPVMKRMEDVPEGDPRFRGVGGPIEPRPAAQPEPDLQRPSSRPRASRATRSPTTSTASASRARASTTCSSRTAGARARRRPTCTRRRTAEPRGRHRRARRRACCSPATAAPASSTSEGGDHGSSWRSARSSSPRAPSTRRRCSCARASAPPASSRARDRAGRRRPGVGRNLHDHLLMGVLWEAASRFRRRSTTSPSPRCSCAATRRRAPDLHFMFIHVPFHLPTFAVPEGSWTIAVGARARPRAAERAAAVRRAGGQAADRPGAT